MSGLPDLNGKVAIVTGGASGIGKGIATRLVAEGAHVVIAVVAVSWPSYARLVRSLVLAARTAPYVVASRMLGVNLWGVIHGIHTFLPILKRNREGGHIVNTASMAGLVAGPRLGAYAAAKYGVVGLTEVLAAELATDNSRVGVSVLCPGTVHTNIGHSSRNRPADLPDAGFKDIDIELEDNPRYRWVYPDVAGAVVVRAIKRGDLYALTHPDWYPMVAERHEAIAAAFREQEELRQEELRQGTEAGPAA